MSPKIALYFVVNIVNNQFVPCIYETMSFYEWNTVKNRKLKHQTKGSKFEIMKRLKKESLKNSNLLDSIFILKINLFYFNLFKISQFLVLKKS